MRKILFLLLIVVSFSLSGQSTFKQGIKVGSAGTVVDKITTESGVVHVYNGATDIPLANNDTTIQFRIEIDNATDTSDAQTIKIDANTGTGATNADNISDNTDSVGVHGPLINTNIGGITDNISTDSDLRDSITTNINDITTNINDITTVNGEITTLENNTVGVHGFKFSFSSDSTLQVISAGDTMVFTRTSSASGDITAPTISDIELGNYANDTIVVTFDEPMDTDSIPAMSAFTFTEDGTTYGLAQAYYNNDDSLYIPIDSVGNGAKTYLLTYTRPGLADLQDVAHNNLITFSNHAVVNNVPCSSTTVKAHYLFENNANDETTNYNAAATDGATYTAASPIQGTHSGDLDGAGRYFAIPSIPYTSSHAVSMWARVWGGGSIRNLFGTLQSDDGFKINYNFTLDRIEVTTGNGSSTASAYSTSGLSYVSGTAFHVVVVFDRTAGACAIYFNGSDVTSTSTIRTDYATTSIARVGYTFTGSGDLFGFVDDLQIYDANLTAENVTTLYNNIGVSLTLGGCGDPPVPSDSVVVVLHDAFESWAVQVNIPEDTIDAHFPGTGNLQGEVDDIADDAAIVSYDGSHVFKSIFLKDQCCVEWQTYVPCNGGTGVQIECPLDASSTKFSELYVSYNIYLPSIWENSDGYKLPGFRTSQTGGESSSMRTMGRSDLDGSVGFGAYDNIILYYIYDYTSSWTNASTAGNVHWTYAHIGLSAWHNITIRMYAGTYHNEDGLIEVFYDGVFVGFTKRAYFVGASGEGINTLAFNTFMGGSSTDYWSPKDQYHYIDDLVVWYYKSGADVPQGGSSSGVDRDLKQSWPSQVNYPR